YATLNSTCKNDLKFNSITLDAVASCQQFLSTIQEISDTMALKMFGKTFSDIDMRDVYNKEDYELVHSTIKAEMPGLDPIFNRLKPFMIYSVFDIYHLKKNCDTTVEIERELMKIYKKRNSNLLFLDSF